MVSTRGFVAHSDDDDAPIAVHHKHVFGEGEAGFITDFWLDHTGQVPITVLNTPLPSSVTDGHGNLLFGAGNAPTGFASQDAGGLLVFEKFILRQGADIAFDGIGSAGAVVEHGPSGAQPGAPTYAAWNFNYGVAATDGHTLADFDVRMNLTFDGQAFLQLDLIKLPNNPTHSGSGEAWVLRSDHSVVVIGDDSTVSGGAMAPGALGKVSENSENIKFFLAAINGDPNNPGPYHYETGHDFGVEIVGTLHNTSQVIVDQTMHIMV